MTAANRTAPPPLVLIPGLLCTPDLFAPQLAALRDCRRAEFVDHTRHDTLRSIVKAALPGLPQRFALAGLSMGGYVAFEMLRQAPERIARLMLLDTNARADRPEQVEQRRALVRQAEEVGLAKAAAALRPVLVHRDRLGDAVLMSAIDRMAAEIGLDAFRRQQEAIISRPDNRPFLKEIRCPVTIVVGAEDALTPVKVHEEMAAGIAGSRLVVIPDCGHLSTLEKPAVVSRIMLEWLGCA